MQHSIVRVTATPLRVQSSMRWLGVDKSRISSMCLVAVETKSGHVGHGLSYLADGPTVAHIVNTIAAPAIAGADALAHEQISQTLYWTLTGAAQSGFACNAMGAVDIALWDIKGKVLNQPIWRLLGAARDTIPVYATLGLPNLKDEELVTMARNAVAKGFKAIKIQVGRPGLDQRTGARPLMDIIAEDVSRLRALRGVVGDTIEIAIDGSSRFDLPHAVDMANRAKEFHVAWYEEPLLQNDVMLMAELRRHTGIKVSAGQNEGLLYRFRDMILAKAVDVIQPNVSIAGGYTLCTKIAALAAAFNMPVVSGGGSAPFHNMHLQAGVSNGTQVEYQSSSTGAYEALFEGLPEVRHGMVRLPEKPGLGFEPRAEAVKEYSKV